ncbi:PssE/Cps14G family polysaccharide biosynthesis glycosyltransferase [Enterobacter cloacae complex sp. JNL001]|uniref:PssE/Cps14G family polysaccharide biosynthesis glycosyltransferase n=1 Tax=Enterobacter cloacae complex TaxID=354276 RepID=UPI001012847D|nr:MULTISPECIES: PssE/Cps14G family polysaccharide biosynthesis glycosyltransferase [Enterobacter cloacae complex]MBQ0460723.1 hypothetical protein [Enterobacter hormaechei]RYA95441.1 hypothetical protein DD602_06085 [Enterobacter cloacae complex sp. 743-2DZ2F-22B]HAV1786727.1 hypothetical protein [Enterobacter hormaechei subsp. xiangfangensis]HCA7854882.1 hypothetical protein [Enterobacter hormaechei]
MKILVTVGTTRFDKLIKQIASISALPHMANNFFMCQKANGLSNPETENYKEVEFIQSIENEYSHYDLVISHAGAGSIFSLLDHEKKIIIAPNLDRLDKHQSDIAKYMGEKEFAMICWYIEDLENLIINSSSFQPKKFELVRFFKNDEFIDHINNA